MNYPSNWAPSRFHLAIFRLMGILHLSRLADSGEQPPVVLLSFEKGQGQPELAIVSFAWFAIPVLYLTALLESLTGLPGRFVPLLILIAIPVSFIGMMCSMWLAGLMIFILRGAGLIRSRLGAPHQERWQNILMSTIAVASQWWDSWVRFVGAFWIAALIVNGMAAIALWMLHARVTEIEARFGASAAASLSVEAASKRA